MGERIKMHKLVEQFGRETSRKQFVHSGLTKRQLLVNKRDISEVFNDDSTDSNRFIAINVYEEEKSVEEETEEEMNIRISDKSLKRISDLQFVRVASSLIPQSVLQSLIFHSPKIRSLIWSGFENICLPSTFNTKFLVKLNLQHCKFQKLWEGNKVLKNLKWVDLRFSEYLKELPDLSTATKLEELNLRFCSSLVEIPDLSTATKLGKLEVYSCTSLVTFSSIGNFNNFEEFDLSFCKSLVELPSSIATGTNLQRLNLKGCSTLVRLPSSIGNLINLEEIFLTDCSSLVEIPFSIGNLQKLKNLKMTECSKLEAFPTNINLKSLERLDLEGCSQLKSFPEISTNIKELYLTGTAINEISLTIMLWSRLQTLILKDCNNLVSLPQLPDSLCHLDARGSKSLESLDCSFNNPAIVLNFRNCFKLNEEARDLIINTSCGYAILPGGEVPACFNYCRVTDGGLFTIKLNESPLPPLLRFRACIMLVEEEEGEGEIETLTGLRIEIMTKANNHMIPYSSSSLFIEECSADHIYIDEVAFEVGAEVDPSTELFFKFGLRNQIKNIDSKWKVRECGLMQI